ncbi:unnamed protein product [Acanthosepion pharaonis]|uniref:Uncharacterized protein n=1 Tax=Acanthosepion pharaonis TaxID=158019 RepID=A0A812BJ57_ACAPH|nr:unnamed protein product [Sepia pharaonis]
MFPLYPPPATERFSFEYALSHTYIHILKYNCLAFHSHVSLSLSLSLSVLLAFSHGAWSERAYLSTHHFLSFFLPTTTSSMVVIRTNSDPSRIHLSSLPPPRPFLDTALLSTPPSYATTIIPNINLTFLFNVSHLRVSVSLFLCPFFFLFLSLSLSLDEHPSLFLDALHFFSLSMSAIYRFLVECSSLSLSLPINASHTLSLSLSLDDRLFLSMSIPSALFLSP